MNCMSHVDMRVIGPWWCCWWAHDSCGWGAGSESSHPEGWVSARAHRQKGTATFRVAKLAWSGQGSHAVLAVHSCTKQRECTANLNLVTRPLRYLSPMSRQHRCHKPAMCAAPLSHHFRVDWRRSSARQGADGTFFYAACSFAACTHSAALAVSIMVGTMFLKAATIFLLSIPKQTMAFTFSFTKSTINV